MIKIELLKVENLTFGYEDDPVLKNFNLSVTENEIILIDGINGAGKTTLLKCITNLLNNGENIYINGTEVFKDKDVLKAISFIMSDDTLYDYMTLEENITFFMSLFKEKQEFIKKVYKLCEELKILQYRNYLVKNLSQGTRNKLYLSIMLSKKHSLLILDEPFTALDKTTQQTIIKKIHNYTLEENKSVIMVTHVKEFKKIATRTAYVEKISE